MARSSPGSSPPRGELPLEHPAFVCSSDPAIEAREGDIFGPDLSRDYAPSVVELPRVGFLHYLKRKAS